EEWFNEKLAQRCLDALKRNNIPGYYAPDRNQALAQILGMIPSGVNIGVGDSVTLHQVGVIEELEKRGSHQIFNPFRKEGKDYIPATMREMVAIGLEALSVDFFLTGSNAITLDGKIVNIDGGGNRVTGMLYGPKKVIAVAGINKIVANVEEGIKRIKGTAAPINAKRHNLKHGLEAPPCTVTGVCVDCHHPRRICCYTTIIEFQRRPRIEVVIVGEELGI
ncbi:lactate utilization protein, partial [Chloroflexota bacterium]